MQKSHGKRVAAVVFVCALFLFVYIMTFVRYGKALYRADITVAQPICKSDMLYYNNLSRKNQLLYDAISDAIANYDEYTKEIPYRYTSDEFNDVVKFIICDNPMYFYVTYDSSVMYTNDTSTKVQLYYTVEKENAKNMCAEVDSVINSLIGELKTDDEYSTELNIHDYLVKNCEYLSDDASEDYLNNTAYGALVNKKSYCDGYALAFKELMNRCGLFCSTVCGNANNLNHMWNIVCVNNNFYQVDVTWDDADVTYVENMIFHGYFNLTTEQMSKNHNITYADILPQALDSDNYYNHKGIYAASEDNINTIVPQAVRGALESGRKYFEIALGYEGAQTDLRSCFSETVRAINAEGKYNITDAYREHYCSDDKSMMNIEIYYEEVK